MFKSQGCPFLTIKQYNSHLPELPPCHIVYNKSVKKNRKVAIPLLLLLHPNQITCIQGYTILCLKEKHHSKADTITLEQLNTPKLPLFTVEIT